jgi:putative spore cortex-lytic enzyme
MPRITSLLKSICGKIMSIPMRLTKKMYRQMALLTIGGAVISVVAFSSNGFAGSGKNAVSANVINSGESENFEDDMEDEADDILDNAGLDNTTVDEDIANLPRIEQKETGNEKMERLLEERRVALGLSSLTVEDYNNLLRIVEAEVGDNDVYGRTIVANVVLNRVRSSHFENTITEVIFSKGQFSPIRDKRFFKVKGRKSHYQRCK